MVMMRAISDPATMSPHSLPCLGLLPSRREYEMYRLKVFISVHSIKLLLFDPPLLSRNYIRFLVTVACTLSNHAEETLVQLLVRFG